MRYWSVVRLDRWVNRQEIQPAADPGWEGGGQLDIGHSVCGGDDDGGQVGQAPNKDT